jgi:hypothetical protein
MFCEETFLLIESRDLKDTFVINNKVLSPANFKPIKIKNSSVRKIQFYIRYGDSTLLSKNLKIKIYNITIILPVVLYGCETWSLTFREEYWLRVFENRVVGRIFGTKRDKVTGEWRKLHNEELNDLYSSPNIVCVIKSKIMG